MVTTIPVTDSTGTVIAQDMRILIDRGKRVKVVEIKFEGNKDITDRKLRGFLKRQTQKSIAFL